MKKLDANQVQSEAGGGRGRKNFFFSIVTTLKLSRSLSPLMSILDGYQHGICGLSTTMVKKILEVPWFSFFHVTTPN